MPCWADLSAPDVKAAWEFYAVVLGWDVVDPDPEYGNYVMAGVAGHAVAGIGPVLDQSRPPSWTMYFASDDQTQGTEGSGLPERTG